MQKYHVMAIKQHLGGKCVTFIINTREIFTNYFSHEFDRLSNYDVKVDWVLADYNGYYIQESGKSDKYGFFSVACLRNFQ